MEHSGFEKPKVLWEFVSNSIKSDGKMKEQNLTEEEVRELRNKLRTWLGALKRGEGVAYLPFTAEPKGFRSAWLFLRSEEKAEDVYVKIKALIEEIAGLRVPIPIHNKSIEKCIEITPLSKKDKAVMFTSKYLSLNRLTIIQILDMLAYYGGFGGTISLLQRAITLEKLDDVYEGCKNVIVGGSKYDIVIKRLHALARMYDNLFVILGAAAHEPIRYGEMRFHRGRSEPYTLLATPFTRGLQFVLTYASTNDINDYVSALREFTSIVIRSFNEDLTLATVKAKKALENYRHINLDISEDLLRRTMTTLRWLLSTL